jgi:3-phenylpropionate/cinnamic acid dioxygenase small subunit
MVCTSNRYHKSSKSIVPLNRGRGTGEDIVDRDEQTLLDETKKTLAMRVARLETGMAWAEDPPSRTRHLISNIEVQSDAAGLEARCNFIVYRSRSETEQDFYVGGRRDLLRRVDGSFKIASRKLTLDQNVLLAKNVSIFF